MNLIRYWRKQYYIAAAMYDNCGKELKDAMVSRLFNLACEIGERLDNLKEEE